MRLIAVSGPIIGEAHSVVSLSFLLARNLSSYSEGFPTRFPFGNDNCEALIVVMLSLIRN